MKLHELKIVEGLVDINTLMSLRSVAAQGISSDDQIITLAKALMAIDEGYTFNSVNFNAYMNEFFPSALVIQTLKGLSKENAQQLASFVLSILEAKSVQLASLGSFKSIGEIIAYATRAEAND